MSFVTRLLGLDRAAARTTSPSVQLGIIPPWSDQSPLAHIAWQEILGTTVDLVNRGAAMRVAPIKRGRSVIVGALADLPFLAGRFAGSGDGDAEQSGFTPIPRQPAWLTRTNTTSTPWHRMAWTLDDLIFYGWSLWALERSEAGTITDAIRVAQEQWAFDDEAPLGIRVGDRPLQAGEELSVCLFAGPDEGILASGEDIIRGARAIERAWVGRVRNPIPLTVLHERERNGIQQTEATALVAAYAAARQSPDGSVSFLPSTLDLETYGEVQADLFIEGRNAVRLDVANLLNLPASVLDGSTATASLTYQTTEGQFSQIAEYLDYWLAPIEWRLSQNDITPRGQVIRAARRGLTKNEPFGSDIGGTTDADTEQPAIDTAEEVAA